MSDHYVPKAITDLIDLDSVSETVRNSIYTYGRFLDDEAIENLKNLDEGDRAYFWTYIAETIPSEVDKAILNRIERHNKRNVKVDDDDSFVGLPFKYAEGRLRPCSWFSRSYIE